MSKMLIKGGKLVNPSGVGQSGNYDVLIEDGKISAIGNDISSEGAQIVDASGKWVMPGFVDMHVHLREPGFEYKEDIASGTNAAVHGGFTSVACMANTSPVNDDISVTQYIINRAKIVDQCRVYPIAAVTKGLKGQELTEMGLLLKSGAVAFSDDGKPIMDPKRMQLALQYAKAHDALIISHCEDTALALDGLMHEGYYSALLGLKGIPSAAEEVMVARDVLLASFAGARLHIAHVSSAKSVKIIKAAKENGVLVTAETAPHYFSANDSWVDEKLYDTNTKMNPPLCSEEDRLAIIEALRDGTIDAIATDHAPHHIDEKRVEFANALNGIVGLETAFSLGITYLVKSGAISENDLVKRMSYNPAKILRIPGGSIEVGEVADVVVADPNAQVVYTEQSLHSKSKNSPFLDMPLMGKIVNTIVGGELKV